MARKLFGTDGIRGTVNAHPMTSRIAMDVAVAAVDDDAVGATIGWQPVRPASLPTLMRKVWKVAQRQIERSWTRRSRRVAGRQ